MGRTEIVEVLGRRHAAWVARDAAALARMHAPDAVVISPAGGVLEGRVEIERVYRQWLAAFPDIVVEVEELIIEGDRVAELAKMSGTHAGELFGVAPSGRHVDMDVVLIMTIKDGLIVEERRVYDFTGFLVKVGVLKAKPTA